MSSKPSDKAKTLIPVPREGTTLRGFSPSSHDVAAATLCEEIEFLESELEGLKLKCGKQAAEINRLNQLVEALLNVGVWREVQ